MLNPSNFGKLWVQHIALCSFISVYCLLPKILFSRHSRILVALAVKIFIFSREIILGMRIESQLYLSLESGYISLSFCSNILKSLWLSFFLPLLCKRCAAYYFNLSFLLVRRLISLNIFQTTELNLFLSGTATSPFSRNFFCSFLFEGLNKAIQI